MTRVAPTRPSLRRLVIFEAVIRCGSIGTGARDVGLSQPAATHALAKLEEELADRLLERGSGGSSPTVAGTILYRRVERMLRRISTGLARLAPTGGRAAGLARTLTDAQLRCHLAIAAAGSFRAAADRLRISEPSLHRAARSLEALLQVPLYRRQPNGIGPSSAGRALAAEFRLANQEIDQAVDELAAARGLAGGRLSIGSLPLMPKSVLAQAIGELLRSHPAVAISLEEGSHHAMETALAGGEVDMMLGALRAGASTAGLERRPLFADPYALVVGTHHALSGQDTVSEADLAAYPWVVPWRQTPRRDVLEALFDRLPRRPQVVMETSSLHMMRATLSESPCLTILSRSQIDEDAFSDRLSVLPVALAWPNRTVGVTTRVDWLPTAIQKLFLDILQRQTGGRRQRGDGAAAGN